MPIRTLCVALAMLSLALVGFASDPPAPPEDAAAPYAPGLPAGAAKYKSARYTQEIAVTNDRDRITPVPILDLTDKRWHQPGGLEGVDSKLYVSERYRYLPPGAGVRSFIGQVRVFNGLDAKDRAGNVVQKGSQFNHGILRTYPDKTRFDEVLRNADTGRVFEHRVRQKVGTEWKSEAVFRDETQYPKGYSGLKVSCSSCHAEAGTGKYAEGLVPGGDTVLGDPLDWKLWTRDDPESREPVLMKDRPRLVIRGVLHYEGPDGTYRPVPKPDPKKDAADRR